MLKIVRVVQMNSVHGAVCITPAVDHTLCNRMGALEQAGAVMALMPMGTVYTIVYSFAQNSLRMGFT
jgi:uncharacterized membrane protein